MKGRRSFIRNVLKTLLCFAIMFIAFRICDTFLSVLVSRYMVKSPLANSITCPPKITAEDHVKILKDPSQFQLEDGNLPYVVENYRENALAKQVVRALTWPIDLICNNLKRFGIAEPGGHDGHLVW